MQIILSFLINKKEKQLSTQQKIKYLHKHKKQNNDNKNNFFLKTLQYMCTGRVTQTTKYICPLVIAQNKRGEKWTKWNNNKESI